jgi:hypothetical protein
VRTITNPPVILAKGVKSAFDSTSPIKFKFHFDMNAVKNQAVARLSKSRAAGIYRHIGHFLSDLDGTSQLHPSVFPVNTPSHTAMNPITTLSMT